jgi:hypothetical protein
MSDTPHAPDTGAGLDMRGMPREGLAAYWLSLKKLLDDGGGRDLFAQEAGHTPAPFVQYLLSLATAELDEEHMRSLAATKKRSLLLERQRSFASMRKAVLGIAAGESPRATLITMLGCWPHPLIAEARAGELAQTMLHALDAKQEGAEALLAVDTRTKPDRLLVKLNCLAMLARRGGPGGPGSLADWLPLMREPLLSEGLSLVIDNFESRFVESHMQRMQDEILAEMDLKMDLATDMALGLVAGMNYAQLALVAGAYLD